MSVPSFQNRVLSTNLLKVLNKSKKFSFCPMSDQSTVSSQCGLGLLGFRGQDRLKSEIVVNQPTDGWIHPLIESICHD